MEMTPFIPFLTLSLTCFVSYLQLTIHFHLQKMGHRDRRESKTRERQIGALQNHYNQCKNRKKMHNKPGVFFYFQFFGPQIPQQKNQPHCVLLAKCYYHRRRQMALIDKIFQVGPMYLYVLWQWLTDSVMLVHCMKGFLILGEKRQCFLFFNLYFPIKILGYNFHLRFCKDIFVYSDMCIVFIV